MRQLRTTQTTTIKRQTMKQLFTIIFATLTLTSFGQDKYNYVHFNKLTEVVGTEYVIASIENWGKSFGTKSRYLLFINTKTGLTKQIDFPNDDYMEKIEQVKSQQKTAWNALPKYLPAQVRFLVQSSKAECEKAAGSPFPFAKFISSLPQTECAPISALTTTHRLRDYSAIARDSVP